MARASADDEDPLADARILLRYQHLLPPPSAGLSAKMASSAPAPAAGRQVDAVEVAPPAAPAWPRLDEAAARDRALGCLLGLAVGDAVGAAVEFKARDEFRPLVDMVGGGPFALAAGEWTDDTTMALCLADSLIALGDVDQDDLMERFQGWLERGENTVPGRCFDIGGATRAAIERFMRDGEAAAGSADPDTAGNGSLVRLAPLAIFSAAHAEEAGGLAVRQSRATHGAPECLSACTLFVAQLIDALNGASKADALRQRVMALTPKILALSGGDYKDKPRDAIRSSGYVVHTLEAALWSVWQTDNFEQAVLLAANLGDDADSVAAAAGQLAGALYGASSIPKKWLERLAWRARIEQRASDLFMWHRWAGSDAIPKP